MSPIKILSATALYALAAATGLATDTNFEKDRTAILAMSGAFKVHFQFEETITLAGKPSEPHTSDALELVKVVEDTGKCIRLQHLLLAGGHVVKHWRQDWTYEDRDLYVYRGHHAWEPAHTSHHDRKGAWTQAVYNVDDSPRYESVGRWQHIGDHSTWESGTTWRPLPRREYSKRDDYDALVGRNRHVITPNGWVQLEENYKLALRNGTEKVLGYDHGVNTYERVPEDQLAPSAEYWEKNQAFWADVRAYWAATLNGKQSVAFKDKDDETSVIDVVNNLLEEAQKGLSGDTLKKHIQEKTDAALILTPTRAH